MPLDFPSFVNAISPVVKEPYLTYFRRTRRINAHEFINSSCRSVQRIWRGAFDERYIFTRGTGASALFMLSFWLQHVANSFRNSLEHYLEQIKDIFPVGDWRSGSGRLSVHKGAGAGRKIVDAILKIKISDLNPRVFPNRGARDYLDERHPFLLRELEGLLSPSRWKPFVRVFVDREMTGAGVYVITGLDRELSRAKFRGGQTTDVRGRLRGYLSTIQGDFPDNIRPIFYSAIGRRKGLDTLEQALFHLIPRDLRLRGATHPRPCELCDFGL